MFTTDQRAPFTRHDIRFSHIDYPRSIRNESLCSYQNGNTFENNIEEIISTKQLKSPTCHSSITPLEQNNTIESLTGDVIKALLKLQLAANIKKQSQDLSLACNYTDKRKGSISSSASSLHNCKTSEVNPVDIVASQEGKSCLTSQKSLYKTELCKRFLLNSSGKCEYGLRCRFAHGLRELHLSARHPRYKTIICCAYQLTGTCKYGRRCDFVHDESPEYLHVLWAENELYQLYCTKYPHAVDVTLLEVIREFAPLRSDLRQFLRYIESKT